MTTGILSPKAEPNIRIFGEIVYLGVDSKKSGKMVPSGIRGLVLFIVTGYVEDRHSHCTGFILCMVLGLSPYTWKQKNLWEDTVQIKAVGVSSAVALGCCQFSFPGGEGACGAISLLSSRFCRYRRSSGSEYFCGARTDTVNWSCEKASNFPFPLFEQERKIDKRRLKQWSAS
jgi:hypothetical protein